MEVQIIEKSEIIKFKNQNGVLRKAELVVKPAIGKKKLKAFLYNKVIDLFYENIVIGEVFKINKFHYRNEDKLEIIIDSDEKAEQISQDPFDCCFIDEKLVCQVKYSQEPINFKNDSK